MPKDRVETAQLQREIVGVAVHDLGSVAAALVMRAALPPAPTPEWALAQAERQQAALSSLADQVRAAMQLLEVARIAPDASPPSATAPAVPLAAWLQRWPALGRVALPRGARLRVDTTDPLPESAYALPLQADVVATAVLISALHALSAAGDVTLQVAIRAENGLPPAMVCSMRTASRVRRSSKWQRYAEHVLSTVEWPLQWWKDDGGGGHALCLTVPLVRPLSKESV